jgi:hypothetical protein
MVHSLADITNTGVATPLQTTSQKANWVSVQGKTVATTARVGDSLISSTRGALITGTNGYFFWPTAGNTNQYDLKDIYIFGTNGDVFSVIYNVD